MIDQKHLDNCLVVTFCHGERTEKLNDLCFEKLGFKNRINLSGPTSFHEKFLQFADLAVKSEYEFFIRNDADRLVFDGILELFKIVLEDSNISWATGSFYDYLMNRFRIGTPSIHRKDCLKYLVDNKHLMSDVQKPEAAFARSIQDKFLLKDVDVFTNLHEYGQFPSKVCNAFLNRLARNHYPRLYDDRYLQSIPSHYRRSIEHAFSIYKNQGFKNSMVYQDFSFLDEGFSSINDSELNSQYEEYSSLCKKIKESKNE